MYHSVCMYGGILFCRQICFLIAFFLSNKCVIPNNNKKDDQKQAQRIVGAKVKL